MPSHRFQWNFDSLKGLPQNSKRQTGFCFGFFRGEIDHAPGFSWFSPRKSRLENIFSTFHHQEIPRRSSICSVPAWPFMRSKNCWSFFFQEDTSRKFLILLLSYFPVFWLQISSTFAIIFADCHGLSCVHVRASSYTALFRVSLGGVGLRCVGLAQKISARCNTGSYVFSFFFIWIFILLLALSHIYVFLFPQRVPSDLEVGCEKSILTRN